MFSLKDFFLPQGFRGKSGLYVQLWWVVQALFVKPSPQVAYGWRRWILRIFGAEIGIGVLIRPSVEITYPWKLKIGDYSWIGDDVVLYSLGEIVIGKNSIISQKSYLCTGSHRYTSATFDITSSPIHIGDSVWVATDVFIGPGVKVGDLAVIGARSSVFSDVPNDVVMAGSPAKFVRQRPSIVQS